ncbi:MAG: Smr/MutS family protein [Bryobacteraceae bacterium]|nr:Smr/MutS family protein [Bryobacteraceae bacterium]
MNLWSLDLLEYETLRALLRREVHSPMGRERLDALTPHTDRAALCESLADVEEALRYVRYGETSVRFTNLTDPTVTLQKLRIEGAILEATEIYELASLLDRARDLRTAILDLADSYPRLAAHAGAIGDFTRTLSELSGKILPDGTLTDEASPALARLRRDRLRQQKAIQDSLNRFLRAHGDDGVLQENFVTLRNDRFVVPLVPSQKGRVPGVVHGSSASGQTVFVEPLETIELNNDLVRLNDEELREIHRILREMTLRLREERHAIAAAAMALADLDFLFGKAHFAQSFDCTVPVLSPEDNPCLRLKNARHPLLVDVMRRQKKTVTPLKLTLDPLNRTLLISGPNTGGKTVAMKCIGLLALMAQSGLPVPAEEAELPVFDQVLADIGDSQSIAESLSSFSSHVVRVKAMQELVTPDSLILLDELGRATDPEEGGALAVALLDDFRTVGAFCLASTHLLAVKVYGATTSGVVNGSMGFNEETLEPTYLLRTGAPGKSAGLDIASRLGIPPRLIAHARSLMGTAERDIARFLDELHLRVANAREQEEALSRERAKLRLKEEQLTAESARREAQKFAALEKEFGEALADFRTTAAQTLEELDQKDKARVKTAKVEREFKERIEKLSPVAKSAPVLEIKEGVRVRLKGVREIARVRRILGAANIEVEAGFLKLQVPRTDVVEILPETNEKAKLPRNVSFQSTRGEVTMARELNVIGKRAEEACDEVEKFLDQSSLASMERIRIVHGHGMGILKRSIHDLLRGHPLVAKHYAADGYEGGAGATIVELRLE